MQSRIVANLLLLMINIIGQVKTKQSFAAINALGGCMRNYTPKMIERYIRLKQTSNQ
ncbi:hypothetical protein J18TS1_37050 [Oceanobacillus oncorhynchi subsp. incaldanensis]|uniref:hypothetical protein n=1 Tax=Oceanobacillus oncorhynchi TaxID=545501 RepID=UPI001B21D25D|nr:hypothetical protein [Oceanobacillus oncorhynchi]GIO20605.1 hypothetical protein J18TS1_37050 [Oceanobacillus oncorhynchi subsp. incaldanensis]